MRLRLSIKGVISLKKRVLPFLLAVFAGTILFSSCMQEPASSVTSQLQFAKGTDKPAPLDNEFPEITDDYRNYINKANIVEGNKTICYKNVDYSDIKITKTKHLPAGIKKEDVNYENDGMLAKTDKNGTILNERTYLFVSTRITNKTERKMMIPMWIRVIELDQELSYKGCTITSVYRSGKNLSTLKEGTPERKSYYMEYFEPGESSVYTIGTIVNDDLIDADNLYFILEAQYTEEDYKQPGFELEEDKAYKIN